MTSTVDVKEFFSPLVDPNLTQKDRLELFYKLHKEFSEQYKTGELFQIALLGGRTGLSKEERLIAYEKYTDIVDPDRIDDLYLPLRKLIEDDYKE